jgi:hypothetical protein
MVIINMNDSKPEIPVTDFTGTSHDELTDYYRQFKDTPISTHGGKIYLAACYISRLVSSPATEHYVYVRKVADYMLEHNKCLWHACWEVSGRKNKCHCADCEPSIKRMV